MNRRRNDYKTVPSHRGFYLLCMLTVLLVAFCTSGCSSMGNYERTWQTLHAIDYGQTLHIARSPTCYVEANAITKSLIGSNPSESEVTAVMAGYALAHYGINRFLEEKAEATGSTAWHGTLRFFQASTLLFAARTVTRNHHLGLRPFKSGSTCAASSPSFNPDARPVK